jgi:regulatory protein spx
MNGNGIETLLTVREDAKYRINLDDEKFQEMTYMELIKYITQNPHYLRGLIISDGRRVIVGYNIEEIRTFMPNGYRTVTMKQAERKINEKIVGNS